MPGWIRVFVINPRSEAVFSGRFYTGLLILLVWLVLIALSGSLAIKPATIHLDKILQSPQLSTYGIHALLGYDDLGRFVFDRLISGAKISFMVAFAVASVSLLIGAFIGVISAWLGGWVDHVTVRVIDMFMAFPGILLAIALSGLMGPGISNVIIALSMVSWVGYARLARAQTLALRQREHVLAAIALGQSQSRIVWLHIVPLLITPLLIEFTFAIAGLVIAEAGLSFLGLGVQAPDSSWGSMIKSGSQYLLIAPHTVIMPGLALISVILAINLLADALRDKLDPKNSHE